MFLIGRQQSKITKYQINKKQQQEHKKQIKTSKIVIQNKRREQAENPKQKNILKQQANKTKTKSKNQKLKWETEIHFLNKPKALELKGNIDFHKNRKNQIQKHKNNT